MPGLSAVKVGRLHDLARAALDGRLDTERLRALPEADALSELMTLPGVGPWTAQAILTRGCGVIGRAAARRRDQPDGRRRRVRLA